MVDDSESGKDTQESQSSPLTQNESGGSNEKEALGTGVNNKNILKELSQQQPQQKKEKGETKVTFSQNIIKEFPPITHRTKSWHSFNRCLSTIR